MKILVIRFSSAGDILCTTPLLRLLRRRWSDAQITYLTYREFADLLASNAHISDIWRYARQSSPVDDLRLRRRIRQQRFDLILDLHSSTRSRLITVGGSAEVLRLGKDPLRRIRMRSAQTAPPERPMPLRQIDVVAPLGLTDDGAGLELPTTRIASRLPEGLPTPIIALAPGAHHATKMWPADRFGRTAARLATETGGSIVLLGGPGDRTTSDRVWRELSGVDRDRRVDLTGSTGWLESARALADCDLLISNDSVAGHIAAGTGTPVVSIFGSTLPGFGFVPFRVPCRVVEVDSLACRPCTRTGRAACPEGHFRCMLDIGVDRVVRTALELLAESPENPSRGTRDPAVR